MLAFFMKMGRIMKTIDDYNEILTDRLLLRRVLLTDASQMYQWLSDENTVQWLSGTLNTSIENVENQAIKSYFWQDVVNTKKYGIALKETNELIGSIDFRQNILKNNAEIGYVLTPLQRGKGFMHEAVSNLLKIGFTELNLVDIWISHDIENISSRHIPERLGFEQAKISDTSDHIVWHMSSEQYREKSQMNF